MPSKCCVIGCSKRGGRDSGIRFFRFPALQRKTKELEDLTTKRRRAWLMAIGRTDLKMESLVYTRICSNHFLKGCPAPLNDESNVDWIPCKNMVCGRRTTKQKVPIKIPIAEHEYEMEIIKADGFSEMERLQVELDEKDIIIDQYEEDRKTSERKLEETINNYKQQLKEKEDKIERVIQQMNILKCREALENDNKKVKYFTGLSDFVTLNQLFCLVKDVVTRCSPNQIDYFEAFILSLAKLRLDLPFKYLAYQYGVPHRTIIRTFQENIMVLHGNIEQFIKWPDKAELSLNTPSYFNEILGPRLTAILHSFEMLIETAGFLSGPEALPPSERHSTIKYLIATSPAGAIIFVSKGYSGKCTERTMVETSGFLNYIEAGDIILFATGMLVNEVIVNKGQKLLVNPVQSDDDEMHDILARARNLANLKLRVERIIDVLREAYQILAHRQPIAAYKTDNDEICIDYIVKTCCALFNLSPSILSTEKAIVSSDTTSTYIN